MATNLILGIDPGLGGAFALFEPGDGTETSEPPHVVEVIDTPVHVIDGKKHVDAYALSFWIDQWQHRIRVALIEEVSAAPGNGVTSMFRFGHVYGVAIGVVSAHMIPLQYVRPNVWKRVMKLTKDKDQSRRLASRLFPKQGNELWPNKGHDGRAEAVLLAVYASEMGVGL